MTVMTCRSSEKNPLAGRNEHGALSDRHELGTIGHALNSHQIEHASTIAAWALPFEALYQDGLRMITENTSGPTLCNPPMSPSISRRWLIGNPPSPGGKR